MFFYKIVFSCILKNDGDKSTTTTTTTTAAAAAAVATNRLLQLKPKPSRFSLCSVTRRNSFLCYLCEDFNELEIDKNQLIEKIYLCEKCKNRLETGNRNRNRSRGIRYEPVEVERVQQSQKQRKFRHLTKKWKISLSSDTLTRRETDYFNNANYWLNIADRPQTKSCSFVDTSIDFEMDERSSTIKPHGTHDEEGEEHRNRNQNVSIVHVSNSGGGGGGNIGIDSDTDRKLSLANQWKPSDSNRTTCRWLNGKQEHNYRPDCLNLLKNTTTPINPLLSPPVQFKDHRKCYSQLYQRYLVRKSISGYNYYNYYYVKHSGHENPKSFVGKDFEPVENLNFPRSPSPILPNKRRLSNDAIYSRIPFRERLSNELVKEANLVLNYCSRRNSLSPSVCSSPKSSLSNASSRSAVSSAVNSPSTSSDEVWFSTKDDDNDSCSGSLSSKQFEQSLGGGVRRRPGSVPLACRTSRSMSLPQSRSEVNLMQTDELKFNNETKSIAGTTKNQQNSSQHHYHYNSRNNRNNNNRLSNPENNQNDDIRKVLKLKNHKFKFKSTSTPQLCDQIDYETDNNNKLTTTEMSSSSHQQQRHHPQSEVENIFEKFQKTFSLQFERNSDTETDRQPTKQSEDDAAAAAVAETGTKDDDAETNKSAINSKLKFGPAIWRSSKERKKRNRALRNAKCNSGDSGIQLEMLSGNSGDNDTLSDSFDSPIINRKLELINRILIDKYKIDSEPQRRKCCPYYSAQSVRRTNSDISSHRYLDETVRLVSQPSNQFLKLHQHQKHHQYRRQRHMPSSGESSPQPQPSPSTASVTTTVTATTTTAAAAATTTTATDSSSSPAANDPIVVRTRKSSGVPRNSRISSASYLRRSLSQPIDIDKLSVYCSSGSNTNHHRNHRQHHHRHHHHHHHHQQSNTSSSSKTQFSDDENLSDSDTSSIVSLQSSVRDRQQSLELLMVNHNNNNDDDGDGDDDDDDNVNDNNENVPILAEALFDHIAIESDELGFRAGQTIEVIEMINKDWWWGSIDNRDGWFPAASVRLKVNQEETVEDCIAAMTSGKSSSTKLHRRTSISLLSNKQVRSSVVRELIQTERDFVQVLCDICQGFLSDCRSRTDLFKSDDIQTIFANIEDIFAFQKRFLHDLEACIDWPEPSRSSVGQCFLDHSSAFLIYSDYCNRHPIATVKLQELYQFRAYRDLFENSRRDRNLPEIPLDGYLLTPIQRICKYPLQLGELLKYTKADHDDYPKLKQALTVMKDVATVINERKRRLESLQKLIVWQKYVECWDGDDLIETSSQLIHQGEVIRVTNGMWTNSVTLFLFDHQIIYCRKDILKRNTYTYKGRICLDSCEIIDVPNGKDSKLGVNVRHGLKVYCYNRDKWLLFCCRSATDKQRWLDALKKERELVARDERDGVRVTAEAKNLAKLAAKRLENRPTITTKYRTRFVSGGSGSNFVRLERGPGTQSPTANTTYSFGRKVGNWLTFGGNAKRNR